MSEVDSSVSRMLTNYRDLMYRFVIGEISADEFETDYPTRFKDDPNQVIGEEFDILDDDWEPTDYGQVVSAVLAQFNAARVTEWP
jgi:hypothetical protein